MARPPGFNDKLHFRNNPAQSIYQRPGQAILSESRPNGRCINARPNGRFIKAEATGWPDLQISTISLLSRTISLSAAGPSYSQQKQAQWPLCQREAQWPFYQGRSNRMARPPDFYQREAHWPFYQGRSNRMARPPNFSDKLHFRHYPARSVYQRNGRFINARPNGRFIKSSDSQTPDMSRGLQVPQNPAQSIYQRPVSRSKPNGRFVTAGGCKLAKKRPDSRFTLTARKWPCLSQTAIARVRRSGNVKV